MRFLWTAAFVVAYDWKGNEEDDKEAQRTMYTQRLCEFLCVASPLRECDDMRTGCRCISRISPSITPCLPSAIVDALLLFLSH